MTAHHFQHAFSHTNSLLSLIDTLFSIDISFFRSSINYVLLSSSKYTGTQGYSNGLENWKHGKEEMAGVILLLLLRFSLIGGIVFSFLSWTLFSVPAFAARFHPLIILFYIFMLGLDCARGWNVREWEVYMWSFL